MFLSFQRAVENRKAANAINQPSPSGEERYMFDDIDPDFDCLYKEAKAYEENITKLQRQLESFIANFKETSQSMCAISESLASNLKLDTGVSMDACNYLNAMTAISNESMVEFEHALRQQVLPDVEYVVNENINIEEKMKERLDLLREHDALYRGTLRTSNQASKEQHEKLMNLRGGFFTLQNRLKLELGTLLKDRIKVYQHILSKLSSIQLQLFAKMYLALRKSSGHHTSQLLPKVTETGHGESNLEITIEDRWDSRIKTRSPLPPIMIEGATAAAAAAVDMGALKNLEWDEDTQEVVNEALTEIGELIIEDSLLVAIAVAHCELEVQKQLKEEQEKISPTTKPRKLPSLFADKLDNTLGSSGSGTSVGGRRRGSLVDSPLTGSTSSSMPAVLSPAAAVTGAGVVAQEKTNKPAFNMDMLKKLMSGRSGMNQKKTEASNPILTGGETGGGEVADSDEGWLRLEQEFQQSLMRAAMNAEKKRGGELGGFSGNGKTTAVDDRMGYLASISSFKAFNLPFSIVGRGFEPPASPQGAEAATAQPRWVDWSLIKDAAKYDEAARIEDMATLRTFLVLPASSSQRPVVTPSSSNEAVGNESEDVAVNEQEGIEEERQRRRLVLGAALRFMDVVDLANACSVCRSWREVLVDEEKGRAAWKQSVRRGGCPDQVRAKFWHYLMYNNVPWLPRPKRDGRTRALSTSASGRRWYNSSRYQTLVARAVEQIQHFEKTGRMMMGPSTVFGVVVPPDDEEEELLGGDRGGGSLSPPPPPPPPQDPGDHFGQRRSNWISEIDVDVKRTYVIDRGYDLWKNRKSCSSESSSQQQQQQRSHPRGETITSIAESDIGMSEGGGRRFYNRDIDGSGGNFDRKISSMDDSEIRLRPSISSSFTESDIGTGTGGGVDVYALRDNRVISESSDGGQDSSRMAEGGDDDVTLSQTGFRSVLQDKMSQEDRLSREIQRHRLSRVLWAFAIFNPKVRYCQGMNMVAALLLKVTDSDEEAAFWLLVGMCDHCLLDEMWADGMPRLKLCFHVLDKLIELRTPALHQHFADCGVHVAMFSSKWFVTLFSNLDTLPLKTVLRVWDVFFMEGWSVVFGVVVSLIEMLEGQLKHLDLENVLRMMHDPRHALKEAFVSQLSSPLSSSSSPLSASQDSGQTEQQQEEAEDGSATGPPSLPPRSFEISSFSGFLPKPKSTTKKKEVSGGGASNSSSKKMSVILMRRTSVTTQGDKVLKDVEATYKMT